MKFTTLVKAEIYCVDIFLDREMILGTGEKIFPPNTRIHRLALLDKDLKAPIDRTLLIDSKYIDELEEFISKNPGKPTDDKADVVKIFNRTVFAVEITSAGKGKIYLFVNSDEAIYMDGNGNYRILKNSLIWKVYAHVDKIKEHYRGTDK